MTYPPHHRNLYRNFLSFATKFKKVSIIDDDSDNTSAIGNDS